MKAAWLEIRRDVALCWRADTPLKLRSTSQPHKNWTEKAYPNLIHYDRLDKGGHLAAWERPALFCAEMRTAFRPLRHSICARQDARATRKTGRLPHRTDRYLTEPLRRSSGWKATRR
jgi:hypothetical protein